MATIFFRIRKKFFANLASLKTIWPIATLTVYSLGGAAVLRAADQSQLPSDLSTNNNSSIPSDLDYCIASQSYWGAVYFVNTVYTSIGWGNIYPCSWPAKLLTIIYIFCGIPQVILVLDVVGNYFNVSLEHGWRLLYPIIAVFTSYPKQLLNKKNLKLPLVVSSDRPRRAQQTLNSTKIPEVPLLLGVILTFSWVLICALYFSRTEDWTYFDSLYFCMIAFTTVGFGDFYPTHYENGLTIVVFFFIFVGLALVSMQLQLLQEHIDNLYQQIQTKIQDQYRQRLNDGEAANEREGIDVKRLAAESWLVKFMSKNQLAHLTDQGDHLSKMRVRYVQATVDMFDVAIDNTVPMIDKGTAMGITKVETTTQHSPELQRRNDKLTQEIAIQARALGWSSHLTESTNNRVSYAKPMVLADSTVKTSKLSTSTTGDPQEIIGKKLTETLSQRTSNNQVGYAKPVAQTNSGIKTSKLPASIASGSHEIPRIKLTEVLPQRSTDLERTTLTENLNSARETKQMTLRPKNINSVHVARGSSKLVMEPSETIEHTNRYGKYLQQKMAKRSKYWKQKEHNHK